MMKLKKQEFYKRGYSDYLKFKMMLNGYTTKTLAKELGVNSNTIQDVVAGRNYSTKTIIAICEKLQIPMAEILSEVKLVTEEPIVFPRILKVSEVAKTLNIHKRTVYDAIYSGKLRALTVGKCSHRILEKDLKDYFDNLKVYQGGDPSKQT
jgi:excisionase family DNA binding protein